MKKIDYFILILGFLVLAFIIILSIESGNTINVKTVTITQNIERPTYEYLRSITVYIMGGGSKQKEKSYFLELEEEWIGTGTIIKIDNDYTYILTNRHVVEKEKGEEIILFVEDDLRIIEAEIVAVHKNDLIDLAVIKVKGKLKGKKAIKGISIASPQDKVYLVGHHLGRKYIYGEGFFAGYDSIYDIIQIPTLFGDSGTAVCNKNGKLIALIFAINRVEFYETDVDVAHGLAIDGISIELFLNKLGLLE